jgi:hypothetical protein
MKHSAIVMLLALASGCATTTYAPAPNADSGPSVVFIRQHAEPTAWNVAVLVDGTKAASISNNSYSRFSVEPGRHLVTLHWPALSSQPDASAQVEFPKNQTLYFLVTGSSRLTGTGYHTLIFSSSTALVPIQRTQAEALLDEMKAH